MVLKVLTSLLVFCLFVLTTFAQTTPSPKNCTVGTLDVVFVLDKSGSIGIDNFQKALQAVETFVSQLSISPYVNSSHVGLVTFDDTATLEFGLDAFNNTYDLIQRINNTYYSGGGTDIAAGMDLALRQVFVTPGDRPNIPDYMILITDGQDSSNVAAEHTLALSKNVSSYALGVGDGVDMSELTQAVGQGNVFNLTDWNAIWDVLNHVCNIISSEVPPTQSIAAPRSCGNNISNLWLDAVVILDESQGVDLSGLFGIKATLGGFLKAINIGQTLGQYTRLAFITMGARAHRISNLTNYHTTNDAIYDLMNKMPYLGDTTADLTGALTEAKAVFDQSDYRVNAKNVIIVFSSVGADCSAQQNQDPCRIAAEIKESGIVIITVALTFHEEQNPPIMNFGSPCFATQNDNHLYDNLVTLTTQANCFCFDPYIQFVNIDGCDRYAECEYLVDTPAGYLAARDFSCTPQNSTLADVLSPQKQAFLNKINNDHYNQGFKTYWVGLNNLNGGWSWDSGAEYGGYSNWASNQPNPNSHCTTVFQNGSIYRWQTEQCTYNDPLHNYFCQRYACDVDHYCAQPWSVSM